MMRWLRHAGRDGCNPILFSTEQSIAFDEAPRTNELARPISKLSVIFENYFVFAICDIWMQMEL